MLKKISLSFIALFLFPGLLWAGDVLQFGLIQNVPPYSSEESGLIQGIDYEIYKELKKRLTFESEIKLYPFNRLWDYVKKGQLDVMLQLYYKPERETFVIYSTTPIRWSTHYIFVHISNKYKYTRSDIKALYGMVVGKDRGYYVSPEFDQALADKRFVLDEAGTTAANIKKLASKRVDCYVSAYPVAMATAKELGLSHKIVPLDEPIIPRKGVFAAVSKKSRNIKDPQMVVQKISQALDQMFKDGTMARIEDRFLK